MPFLRYGAERPAGVVSTSAQPTALAFQASAASSPIVPTTDVLLTATVTPSLAAGVVHFTDGPTLLGTVPTVAGVANLTVRFAAGTHLIDADFQPDDPAAFDPSDAAGFPLVVTPAATPTGTVLAVAPASPSASGATLTLTATVSPAQAAGSVQFHDGATLIGTRAVSGGSASMTTTLPVGPHQLTATFVPTNPAQYIDSTSPTTAPYVVNPAPAPNTTLARARVFVAHRPGDIEGLAAGQLAMYDIVSCHPSYSSQLAALKAACPSTRFIVYRDEIACPTGNSDGAMSVSYTDANASHPDWFLLDQTAARLVLADFPSNLWMNQGVVGYQDQWAANAIALCQAQGWHGVFIDDHNSHYTAHLAAGKSIPAYPTETANRLASKAFATNVCARLRAAGYLTMANCGFNFAPVGSTWQQAFTDLGQAADFNMKEFWAYDTHGAGGTVYVTTNWDVQQAQMLHGISLGKGFVPLTYVASTALRDYAWASFNLLAQSGQTHGLALAGQVGGYNPGAPPLYGTPSSSKTPVAGSANCYQRSYPGGILFVNADTASHNLGGVTVASGNAAFVATPVQQGIPPARSGPAINPRTYDWNSLGRPVGPFTTKVASGSPVAVYTGNQDQINVDVQPANTGFIVAANSVVSLISNTQWQGNLLVYSNTGGRVLLARKVWTRGSGGNGISQGVEDLQDFRIEDFGNDGLTQSYPGGFTTQPPITVHPRSAQDGVILNRGVIPAGSLAHADNMQMWSGKDHIYRRIYFGSLPPPYVAGGTRVNAHIIIKSDQRPWDGSDTPINNVLVEDCYFDVFILGSNTLVPFQMISLRDGNQVATGEGQADAPNLYQRHPKMVTFRGNVFSNMPDGTKPTIGRIISTQYQSDYAVCVTDEAKRQTGIANQIADPTVIARRMTALSGSRGGKVYPDLVDARSWVVWETDNQYQDGTPVVPQTGYYNLTAE